MLSDYKIIINNQQVDKLQEYVEKFVEMNRLNNKKILDHFINNILDKFNFKLEVVNPRDAVKFLLFQEAYPDIMEIISYMVNKHYEAFLKERAKDKGV